MSGSWFASHSARLAAVALVIRSRTNSISSLPVVRVSFTTSARNTRQAIATTPWSIRKNATLASSHIGVSTPAVSGVIPVTPDIAPALSANMKHSAIHRYSPSAPRSSQGSRPHTRPLQACAPIADHDTFGCVGRSISAGRRSRAHSITATAMTHPNHHAVVVASTRSPTTSTKTTAAIALPAGAR